MTDKITSDDLKIKLAEIETDARSKFHERKLRLALAGLAIVTVAIYASYRLGRHSGRRAVS